MGSAFFGDKFNDFGGEVKAARFGFGVKDGAASLKTWRLDGKNDTLLTARNEAVGEVGDAGWRAVGGEDDLLVVLLEFVKGVEKFYLAFFFTLQKLDVVNNEDVVGAVFFGETGEFFLDTGDEVFVESFHRDI